MKKLKAPKNIDELTFISGTRGTYDTKDRIKQKFLVDMKTNDAVDPTRKLL